MREISRWSRHFVVLKHSSYSHPPLPPPYSLPLIRNHTLVARPSNRFPCPSSRYIALRPSNTTAHPPPPPNKTNTRTHAMGSIFAHTFLVLGGEGPSLRIVAPEETMQRKKRPHRVSPCRPLSSVTPLLRIRPGDCRVGLGQGPERERVGVSGLIYYPSEITAWVYTLQAAQGQGPSPPPPPPHPSFFSTWKGLAFPSCQPPGCPAARQNTIADRTQCDEGDPCGNCVKRCERCVRTPPLSLSRTSDDSPSPTSMPREMDWSPTVASVSEGVPVNLLHMELLHHFERFTMPTLCWGEVWPTMMQMAFRVRSPPPGPCTRPWEHS